jgi:hypothetical protein
VQRQFQQLANRIRLFDELIGRERSGSTVSLSPSMNSPRSR